jgi:LDH2 family malate/lactate/ureidoglycolate dehydrogenase
MTNVSARCVAEHLVESDLTGHPSHGLSQLIRYRGLFEAGQCDPSAVPVLMYQRGPIVKIDAQGGLGHPAMELAVDTAVDAARQFGIGLAGVVRAGHTGRMGAWAERAAAAEMFSIVMLAASDPPFALAAAPGADPVLRTNPISLGAPATGNSLVLDMAMSVVSESSILVAASRGETVPEGAFVDRAGAGSTDPRKYLDGGVLMPSGGYKGFGLAVLVEALCIAMTGADDPGLQPISGAVVICIHGDAFTSKAASRRSVDSLRERIRRSGNRVAVQAPGDRSRDSRESTSVTVDDEILAILRQGEAGL